MERQQPIASRVPKPSREFLKVINEFRFQKSVIEEEEAERRRSLGLRFNRSPKTLWNVVRVFLEGEKRLHFCYHSANCANRMLIVFFFLHKVEYHNKT